MIRHNHGVCLSLILLVAIAPLSGCIGQEEEEDTGSGFELNVAAVSGYIVGAASIALSVIAWFAAYSTQGAM